MYRVGDQRVTTNVTISTAADGLSGALDQQGMVVAALVFPSTWTAAPLSVIGSVDGSTYFELGISSSGTTSAALALDATSGLSMALSPTLSAYLGSHRYLKLRSGPAAAAVAQTTERTITVVLRPPE